MICFSWFQMLEGKIDFHGDIVALNDDEILSLVISIAFKHTVNVRKLT